MKLSATTALVAVLAGCASTGRKVDADGEPIRKIKNVEVHGNRSFKDKDIVAGLATRGPSGWIPFLKKKYSFDPMALELDRKRVEAFYRERGFFRAKVVDINVESDGGQVSVSIRVEEGAPTRVAAVTVAGAPEARVPAERLMKISEIKRGDRFNHPLYILAKERVRTTLLQAGYAHAEVEGEIAVDRDERSAVVKLRIDPGPVVRFGKVRVEGLERIPASAVTNRVTWKEGHIFDPAKLDTTQGLLYELGPFSVVRLDYEQEGKPEVSDVTIRVTEGQRHEIRLGGGAGMDRSRFEIRARAGYTHRSFLSPLNTLRIDLRPGYGIRSGAATTGSGVGFTGEASVELERDDFLIPRLEGRWLVGYDQDRREAYATRGPRAAVALVRPLFHDNLVLHIGWEARWLDFVELEPTVALNQEIGAEDPYYVGYYEQSAVWDSRDVPLDPRHGWYGELKIEEGGPFAAGDYTYLKATAEGRGYLPLSRRLVLAGRLSMGRLESLTDEGTPITQRFYGGGSSGHRGFGYRRLAPLVRSEEGSLLPVGGDAMFLSSFESRFDWVKLAGYWLGVVGFVDAGDVTAAGQVKLGKLHYAAGLGLRYNTLVGPIRLDVGYRLNRTAEEPAPVGVDLVAADPAPDLMSRISFHISIGEAF